ncbi:putative F-box/FBD/LRR-repeat protein At5g22670 [Mercurialis annua]|uniref:putative F-box/FBD/LRR-repeat protein At5g22670 n=1 Tax=Mercurialis annua TaxID=3986 RepID=UPI00215F4495|nr:putative F-box/FBD/LRR-repeat protein At5g22670 [Mercurialis annua]
MDLRAVLRLLPSFKVDRCSPIIHSASLMEESSIEVSISTPPNQQNRDIISSLPDDVVCHILSYLETKEAIGTTILSKRWRHAWTGLVDFKFDDQNYILEGANFFGRFVDKVLLVHRGAIKSLRFDTRCFPHEHMNPWIRAAAMQNVEELSISTDYSIKKSYLSIPQTLFSCKTIRFLQLYFRVDFRVIHDSVVWLPSLKVLHLNFVYSFDSLTIHKILANAPVLEELLIYTQLPPNYGSNTLRIQSSSLKRFFVQSFETPAGANGSRMVIKAPKLEYLLLHDSNSEEFEIERLSSLAYAHIDVRYLRNNINHVSYANQVVNLLRKINNVKVLRLQASVLEALAKASDDNFPSFLNLVQLKLKAEQNDWQMLPKMLHSSPKLEVLTLIRKAPREAIFKEESMIFKEESVPKCLLSSLETLEFKDFEGNAAEMQILEYILKKASLLKMFRISLSATIDSDKEKHTLSKLVKFSEGANTCRMLVTRRFKKTPKSFAYFMGL